MMPRSTRVKQFADWQDKPVNDYDPEADAPVEDGSGSEGEEDLAGTEHYVSVGTSKLRQREPPALGPKYSGVRISRAALDASSEGDEDGDEEEDSEDDLDGEEFDDPDTADFKRDNIVDDEEIDSDEAFGEGDEEAFIAKGFTFRGSSKPATTNGRKKRPVAVDFLSASEDEEEDTEANDSGDEEMNGQLDESESEEEDSDGEGASLSDEEDEDDDEGSNEDDDDSAGDDAEQENLVKMMKEGQKMVVATISQAAKAEAKKGVAVRKQRRAYDSLLNLRIRLQKGLISVNSMGVADSGEDVDKEPYEAAEEAAIKLWNAIDGFRSSLVPESSKAGWKRKRDFDVETSNQELWDEMNATEERAAIKRKQVLNKWSEKLKSTIPTVNSRQLGKSATQSLVSVLEDQLISSDRLVQRTHVPRSCAPIQAAKKVAEDPNIFDDADFYQLLLKELVDQRTTESSALGGSVPTVRWTAIKEAKTRKLVDRKASKGRKLRYTVHEKLQNFMAPEDRRTWEEDAIDRLFGTLFGQKNELKEEDASDDEIDVDVEEEGLRLFRS